MAWDNDAAADEVVRREAARLGMSETQYRMIKAAYAGGRDVMRDIAGDHVGRHDVNQPASMAVTPRDTSTPHRGSGWVEPRPLTKQPGIDLIDQLVENDTAKQRIQAAQEQLRAALEMQKYEEMIRERDKQKG